jgi:ferrous iron transport protein A
LFHGNELIDSPFDIETQSHLIAGLQMPTVRDPFRPQRMPLTELPAGSEGRVCELNGESNLCARLREMGFCESAIIQKVAGQKTLLCNVCNARIALSERAAQHIIVELVRGGL